MPNLKLECAKAMRKNQTSAESKLWEALRRKNLGGLKFKRQVVIGPYIADFYCHALKLIIEADGEIHTLPEQMSHDMKRQAWLESEGYVVLRFSNDAILNNLDHVLQTISEIFIKGT